MKIGRSPVLRQAMLLFVEPWCVGAAEYADIVRSHDQIIVSSDISS